MATLIGICLLSSFAVSFMTTAAMRRIGPRLGLIDHPDAARKVHSAPTPLGGGVGIWLGLAIPMAAAQSIGWWTSVLDSVPSWLPGEITPLLGGISLRAREVWSILGAGTVIFLLGLLDDRLTLGWRPKLVVQLIVAGLLVSAGIRATVFAKAEWIGVVLSVIWIVVLINAFNFLDNMDALSSGVGLIASAMFTIVMLTGTAEPRWFVASCLLIHCGSLAGFLVHNWPPARIFMGDSGSCLIGLVLASLTIVGTFFEYGHSPGKHVLLAPLCILAVPLYDFCSVVVIRLLQGRSPFHADKQHFSHRLVELGLSRSHAVLTVHLVTLTTGMGALLLYEVKTWSAALMIIGLIGCVLTVIAILETAGRRKASGS